MDNLQLVIPPAEHLASKDNSEATTALKMVLDYLEPIPFSMAKAEGLYETFLHEWCKHIRLKKDDPALMFDSSVVFGKEEQPEENQTGKITQKDYKVITADVLGRTAGLLGHPLTFQGDRLHVFTGKCWSPIDDSDLNHYLRHVGIKVAVNRLLAPDVDFIEKLKKQIGSTTSSKVKGMARNLINFENGTLDILADGTVNFREHRPGDQLLYVLPYKYDPAATCDRWMAFLNEVIPEEGKQECLAEFLGSCFSDVKHEKILLLYGSGANGKSVVMETVVNLYGKDNLTHNTLEEITNELGYYRGNLMKSLLNYAGEISKKVNPDGLKKLASREPMMGRYVWGKPFEVTDYCRSAFNCNVLPEVTETSNGFFRRFLIIPFEYTVPKHKRNPHLHTEIAQTDLPGIMNWVIAGLQRLVKSDGKFTHCPAADAILAQYQAASRNVELFVTDVIGNSKEMYQSSKLYDMYKEFCADNEYTPVTVKEFSSQLLELGFIKTRQTLVYVIVQGRCMLIRFRSLVNPRKSALIANM
jgi:putative DNA primase/helicase